MQLGTLWNADGTARVTHEKRPVFFVGCSDIAQCFHMIAAALIDSENQPQVIRVLRVILMLLNIIKADRGESDSFSLDFGGSDNSDAIQAAFEGPGVEAENINCKVHVGRGANKAPINSRDGEERKAILSEIRADLNRLFNVTQYKGQSEHNPIAVLIQHLFVAKWKGKGQDDFAVLWERETTGARKGNTQLGFMNPGLPNHANGIERHNLDFKKKGEEKKSLFLKGRTA